MSADLLTAAEVGEKLRITEEQVKRRTKREGWPHVRFSGKTIRYSSDHVASIIASHEADVEPVADVSKFDQTSRSKAKSA